MEGWLHVAIESLILLLATIALLHIALPREPTIPDDYRAGYFDGYNDGKDERAIPIWIHPIKDDRDSTIYVGGVFYRQITNRLNKDER